MVAGKRFTSSTALNDGMMYKKYCFNTTTRLYVRYVIYELTTIFSWFIFFLLRFYPEFSIKICCVQVL